MITNQSSNTCVDEIANGIYRISTPVPPTAMPGGFTFNQYLVTDDDSLLYHTGPRKLFPLGQEAISAIIPAQTLRYVGFSHYEADECGSLNEFLKLACIVPRGREMGQRYCVSWDSVWMSRYRPVHTAIRPSVR
jgi:glyoxylase-like metal-dependent hydrolase (beta-lactamase superfamily II)